VPTTTIASTHPAIAMNRPPVELVSVVSAYPDSKPLLDTVLPLEAITAGRPAVLHLFTG